MKDLKSNTGGGITYVDASGRVGALESNVRYDVNDNSVNILSGTVLDVSKGMLRLSQSQKASIIEGVGKDLDIGPYDLNVGNILMKDLKSNTGGGITYVDASGRVGALESNVRYDVNDNSVNILSGTVLDVSKGMLRLSQSQKASIIEGVGKDLDIGAHSLTLETLIATNAEVSGKAVFDGAIVFHAKVVAPGAEINPAEEKKSWFQISSSGSTVSIIGQTKGHIIYVTNIDTTASHTISESDSLVNINRKSTAQFIFTGAGWSRHVDASSSGGGRRRLMRASHEDYDGFSKQKSIEKLKAFQEIDNVPSMDYFQVDSNNIFLRRTKGSKIVLPQASGSGHVIRLYIQNYVQLDKKHIISCPNENVCTFNGNLIVYNEDADSPSDYMSTYTCNGKSLTVGVLSGGLAGGFVEFTDMDFGKWLVNGNLRMKSSHHTSINPCV